MTLERFGQVALPEGAVRDGEVIDEAAVAAQIRHLWSATGFSGKRVILGVGDRHVVVRQVELPAMSPAQLKKTLPFQVQDYLPMPVDQAVLDFHQTGAYTTESGEHVRGLLVAASRVGVMSAVQSVRAAGLRPVSVDLNSFALLRSVGAGPSQPGLTEAIVDVGARVTNLVVHTGGVPQIVRILFMGGQSVTEALSERVGMAPMEAEAFKQEFGVLPAPPEYSVASQVVENAVQSLVDEVRGSLDYYASSGMNPVARVVVSGGGSSLAGMPARLADATRLTVVVGNPIAQLEIGDTGLDEKQMAAIQPLASVPVGLALGAN